MKKLTMVMAILLLASTITSCTKTVPGAQKGRYSPEAAAKNGDVVNLHGTITNLEKFYSFVGNVESGKTDKIRITMYTTEGDPIFYNLDYDGKEIAYTFDDSKDNFAGSGKGKRNTICSNVVTKSVDRGTQYSLSQCKGKNAAMGGSFQFIVPTGIDPVTAS